MIFQDESYINQSLHARARVVIDTGEVDRKCRNHGFVTPYFLSFPHFTARNDGMTKDLWSFTACVLHLKIILQDFTREFLTV